MDAVAAVEGVYRSDWGRIVAALVSPLTGLFAATDSLAEPSELKSISK
jgi:hypothetical protein